MSNNSGHDSFSRPYRVPDCTGMRERTRVSREREVLTLIATGRSNKEIAAALCIAPSAVKTHVGSLLSKLEADSRALLVGIATRRGFV